MCDPVGTKSIACEDIEATVALEVEVTPGVFSQNLQEYEKFKKEQHDECLHRMRTELNAVNSTHDKELSRLVELLREELNLLDAEMSELFLKEITGLEEWNCVLNQMKKKSKLVNTVINEFQLDLTDLEKTLCDSLKRVLGKYKEEAVKIGFLGLKTIDQIFQDNITDLNGKTLHNLKDCEDLKLKFRIEEGAIISKHNAVLRDKASLLSHDRANELWGRVKEEQVKQLVSETITSLEEDNSQTKDDLYQAMNGLLEPLHDLTEVIKTPETENKNEADWENWENALELHFEKVNTCKLQVKELLETVIKVVIESFDNKAKALSQHLRDQFGAESTNNFSIELAKLENKKNEELFELHFCQKVLNALTMTLEKTKPFSLDINSFWKIHLVHENKVRSDLETSIGSCYQVCLKKDQESNSKIKPQLKSFREASDKNKLEALSRELTDIFKGLTHMWDEYYGLQIKTVEDCRNADVPTIIKQTISDANCILLERYPKNLWAIENSLDITDLKENYFRSLSLKCIDYINSIEQKTFSMYKGIENYVSCCEYELSENYECLFADVTRDLNEKYEAVQVEANSKSLNVQDIRKLRLAELDIHSERLNSHQAGVRSILNYVAEQYEGIQCDQKLKLKEFQDRITNFLETQPFETWNQINSAICKLENEWNSLSTDLENRILEGKMICEHKFETLKHSNSSFQKVATHFKNGGNYSQDELKLFSKELKQTDKILASESKRLSNQYTTLMKGISRQELDLTLQLLQDKLNAVLLNDRISEALRLTRMELRSEISQIMTFKSTVISKFQCVSALEKFDENMFEDLVSSACSLLNEMSCTVPLECEQKPRSSSIPESATKKNVGAKINKSVNSNVDIKPLLENVTVEDLNEGANFLSRVKLILSNKYFTLANNIKDALSPKSVVAVKSKKKEPTNNTEMEQIAENIEVVKKVMYSYNSECELLWFEQINDFIKQLAYLRTMVNEFTVKMLEQLHNPHMECLASIERGYKCRTLKLSTEGTSGLNRLRKSIILPLAHPRYQHKLEELSQRAKLLARTNMETYKSLVRDYQDDLQNKNDEYVVKVATMRKTLENIQRAVFDTISYDVFNEKLSNLRSILQNKLTVIGNDIGEQEDSINCQVEEKDNPKYPMTIWADDEASSLSHSSTLTDIEPVKRNCIIAMATSKLKDSVKSIQRLYKDAEAEAKELEKETLKLLKSFEHDTVQAKLMYSNC